MADAIEVPDKGLPTVKWTPDGQKIDPSESERSQARAALRALREEQEKLAKLAARLNDPNVDCCGRRDVVLEIAKLTSDSTEVDEALRDMDCCLAEDLASTFQALAELPPLPK